SFDFYDRGPYREGVPRPAEILGYEPGTFHTSFGNMERYIDALVHAAPDRVVRESIGRSYEFRERALLVIASPEHLRRLDAIREQCVVIVNLAHNPDGHERFVTWINALGSGNPDPLALEQQRQQPWGIGGRTNHYQIDLNRDALAMSQVESREMGVAFRRWRP